MRLPRTVATGRMVRVGMEVMRWLPDVMVVARFRRGRDGCGGRWGWGGRAGWVWESWAAGVVAVAKFRVRRVGRDQPIGFVGAAVMMPPPGHAATALDGWFW